VAKSGHPGATDTGTLTAGVTAGHPGRGGEGWGEGAGRGTHNDTRDRSRVRSPVAPLVHFILEYVEVVGRRHGDDVVLGMPGRVEDLLVEVQTVHADFVLLALSARAHLARLQDLHGLAVLSGGLQGHIPPLAAVEHPEEVVVRAGHHHTDGGRGGERERYVSLEHEPS